MSRYIPGQPFTPNLSTPNLFNAKRSLAPDEYQFYYNFLSGDNISEPQKAGVAVVLMADSARLFGPYRDYFTDSKLKNYYDLYISYPKDSSEYQLAKAELDKFDSFLAHSQLPSDAPAEQVAKARIEMAKVIGSEEVKKQEQKKIQELLASEQNKMMSEIEREAMEKNAKIAAKVIEDHMISKIRQYLAALYDENTGKYFMDDKLSKVEYDIRMYLVKIVQEKKENPVKAMNAYSKFLDELPKNPSLSKARNIIRAFLGYYQHPISVELTS